MFVFPLVTQGDEVLKYVFPTKQRATQQAIRLAEADKRIARLIVFGSAVTLDCGMTSDLDLAIDAPNTTKEDFVGIAHAFWLGVDSEVDLVHYNFIRNELLKREIDQKGVTVYRR